MAERTYLAAGYPVGIDCGDRRPMVLLEERRGSRVLRQIVLEFAEAEAMDAALRSALRDLAHGQVPVADRAAAYKGHWPIASGMTLDKVDAGVRPDA